MSSLFPRRAADVLADPFDATGRPRLVEFMFPGMSRVCFAAEGSRGGGGSSDKGPTEGGASPEGSRPQRPTRVWGERRARELAAAYEALQITVPQIVGTIPGVIFDSSVGESALPQVLNNPDRWTLLARPNDDARPYLHYYVQSKEGDWFYNLRWHTPTPRGAWADSLPVCSIERRWAHYVDMQHYRPHEVLLVNIGAAPQMVESELVAYLSERLGPRIGEISKCGPHAWISMQGYQLLLSEHPRDVEWIRTVRDSAHWSGHPAGLEIPEVAREKGR